MYKCRYFNIKELVSPLVYNQWGEKAWMFFPEADLQDLDTIRESYGSPIIINNWSTGGSLKQCGLRSNLDQIVKDKTNNNQLYLSAHTMGRGFDLHCKLSRNLKLYDHVLRLIKQNKLKSFQRIEDWNKTCSSGGWVHTDSFQRICYNQYTF